MKCPHCTDQTLVLSDRQNVEIDYCPACRGIWLDRGELDKLLERAGSVPAPKYQTGSSKHQQPKSWLNEIFD